MHELDQVFLQTALRQLAHALEHIERNEFCDDAFAKFHVRNAMTDIRCALGILPEVKEDVA